MDFQGTLDASQDIIKKSEIIVGSVHRYPDGKGGLIELSNIKNLGEKKTAEIEFKLLMGLLKNKQIDILGHPFGVYSKFFNTFQEYYMEKLVKKVAETDIAFEINTKYNTNYDKLWKLLKKYNPYISIGSDAHDVKEIVNSFNKVKKVIIK